MSSKPKRLAILGGGQLARMLAEAAANKNLEVFIHSADNKCPAAHAGFSVCSKLSDLLGDGTDLTIFENEFLAFEQLRYFSKQVFVPRLELMEKLSEKLFQKECLEKLSIPSTPFLAKEEGENLKSFIAKSKAHFEGVCVFKWSKYGYDGHGTLITNDQTEDVEIEDFLNKAIHRGVHVYAEKKISFLRELAMLGFHSLDGSFTYLPLVETYQRNGICKVVLGPATGTAGIERQFEEKAAASIEKFCKELNYYGAIAFEYFVDPSGKLLVNEIAPRVHNSGHFSQHCSTKSQFELHVEACLGENLVPPTCSPYFGMLNLLGPFDQVGFKPRQSKMFDLSGSEIETHFYWYDKEDLRAGRKMGHINFSAKDPETLHSCLDQLLKSEANFWEGES